MAHFYLSTYNCIDGATKLRPDGRYNDLWININISEKELNITDNCGGIPIEIAEEYAFRFGRPKNARNSIDFSTGIFGIGMKRALFKLGKYFIIDSKSNNSSFKLTMDVDKWAADDNLWSFPFDQSQDNCEFNEEDTGTKIIISNLHEGIIEEFKDDFFMQSLIKHIQNHISLSLDKGLLITLNGKKMISNATEIYISKEIVPAYVEYTLNDVRIRILAGLGDKGDPAAAGWYIYCNGRLVLEADKSPITGWEEDNAPKFHPTYARFRGFVFFDAKHSTKLPWNTTKTGVDASSAVFINAKGKMKNMFKSVKDILTKLKNLSSEVEREDTEEYINILDKRKISSLSLEELNKVQFTPKLVVSFLPKSPTDYDTDVTITYKKPQKEVDKAKKLLNVSSNKKVGETTFEYYLNMESAE